ncbi:MAG: RNA 2',3'-cyclic phosphodiesterase [Candidatus Dormibacteraeota bacterium]|nr:RNA 2',3'-cyclic phosphodiesterase [Candidatus Dormibacteraeota bacterium]
MRCFLAVPLRPPALGAAQQVLQRLRSDIDAVRWARPETLHITLHFFGSIADERVTAALEAVLPVIGASPRFEVVTDTLGSFPGRGTPRVLWLGSSHQSAAVHELADSVRNRLHEAQFAIDERPFRAHVTLGRPRDPWPRGARAAWDAARSRGVVPTTFVADRAVLFESVTGRDAAVYVERAELPFAAGV